MKNNAVIYNTFQGDIEMKITKTASGKPKIKISKAEWLSIGKTAGWINKQSQHEDIYSKYYEIGAIAGEDYMLNEADDGVPYSQFHKLAYAAAEKKAIESGISKMTSAYEDFIDGFFFSVEAIFEKYS